MFVMRSECWRQQEVLRFSDLLKLAMPNLFGLFENGRQKVYPVTFQVSLFSGLPLPDGYVKTSSKDRGTVPSGTAGSQPPAVRIITDSFFFFWLKITFWDGFSWGFQRAAAGSWTMKGNVTHLTAGRRPASRCGLESHRGGRVPSSTHSSTGPTLSDSLRHFQLPACFLLGLVFASLPRLQDK